MKYIVFSILGFFLVGCTTTQQPKQDVAPQKVRLRSLPPEVSFSASATTLLEGESVTISWTVVSTDSIPPIVLLNGDTVAVKGSKLETPAYGKKVYNLSIRMPDTVIDRRLEVSVSRKPTVVWTPDDISKGDDDGRFTIGCRGQRLTYGYPAPLSTSHIVVKVNGSYATNNPSLARSGKAQLLSGTSIRAGRIGYNRTEIPFRFYGVDILQRVVPVDRQFREITSEADAVYYKMSWTLTNRHTAPTNIGLLYLMDTMIDDNDAARVVADAVTVSSETRYEAGSVPSKMFVYRRNTDESDLTAVYVPRTTGSQNPSSLIVGRWPFLHGQLWESHEQGESYYDSAIMTVWDGVTLQPNGSQTFVTYYGTKQEYPMFMVDNNQNMRSELLTLNYDKSETTLNLKDAEAIRTLVSGKRVFAASISGFSDAQGNEQINLEVSMERAQRIAKQLKRLGVDERLIMVKAYGESQALQSPETQKDGLEADRRIELSVWYE